MHAKELAPTLSTQFSDLVDQLLGWALDVNSPASVCAEVNAALRSFGDLWAMNEEFGLTIARHLVDDLEALAPEPLPNVGRGPILQQAPRLSRFVGCLSAVVVGLGPKFVNAADQNTLTSRCLACLANRVPSEAGAAQQSPMTSASELCELSADLVMQLGKVLRGKLSPHHQLAARVVLAPLHASITGVHTHTILKCLERHERSSSCKAPHYPPPPRTCSPPPARRFQASGFTTIRRL